MRGNENKTPRSIQNAMQPKDTGDFLMQKCKKPEKY